MAYTIEQYQKALGQAQAAGDDAAVADLSKRMEGARYLDAYHRAAADNNIEATEDLAQRYRETRGSWSRADARSDPMWVKNARTLHKDVTKKDFTGDDQEAADWLSDYMSDFNYRLVPLEVPEGLPLPLPGMSTMINMAGKAIGAEKGTLNIASDVQNFSKEGKAAFLAAMDDFDALPASMEGTGELAKRVVTDPSTVVGAGTFGIGTGVAQGAKEVAKQGLKQALKFGAKQAAKAGAISAGEGAVYGGTSEALRQKAEIGAGGREDYDPEQIAKSAGTAAAVSGVAGTVLRGAVDTPTILKGANKLKVDDQSAAGRVAERLKKLQDNEGFNLSKTDDQAEDGPKQAIGTLHSEISQEITDNARLLEETLRPNKAPNTAERERRLLAQQALRTARSKEKAFTSSENVEALQKLIGDTREGARLVDLVKERNELYRIHNRGYKGGVSQVTDEFMPFMGKASRLGGNNHAVNTAASLYGGYLTGGHSLIGQAAVFGTGRVIDGFTGRRSLAKLYMKQNLGKAGSNSYDHLPSALDAKNAATATKAEAKQFKDNLRAVNAKTSLQTRMERQLQKQTDSLVRTRTGLNKQLERQTAAQQIAEQKVLKDWQKQRAALNKAEQAAKNAAEREKVQVKRRELDAAHKKDREEQTIAKQIVMSIGGPAALRKAMKAPKPGNAPLQPRAKTLSDQKVIDPNPIRNHERWANGMERIRGMEQSARDAAKSAPSEKVGRAINRAVDAFQRIKSSSHADRMEAYEAARAVAKNEEELLFIEDHLDQLARILEHKKKKKP